MRTQGAPVPPPMLGAPSKETCPGQMPKNRQALEPRVGQLRHPSPNPVLGCCPTPTHTFSLSGDSQIKRCQQVEQSTQDEAELTSPSQAWYRQRNSTWKPRALTVECSRVG